MTLSALYTLRHKYNILNFLFLYLADQALWYLPMRRALSLAKNGAWCLSHMDDAVMAEFLIAPVIIPSGRLHKWPRKNIIPLTSIRKIWRTTKKHQVK